jgi:hypothetical protein
MQKHDPGRSPHPFSGFSFPHWLGVREWPLLLALLAPAAAAWAFLELADEVGEGSTEALDERLLLSLRSAVDPADPLGPPWLQEMMRDFTALGGVGVLTLITLAAAGYLLIVRKWRAALAVLVAVGGGILISQLIKAGIDRPRPDLVPHGSYVSTASSRRCWRGCCRAGGRASISSPRRSSSCCSSASAASISASTGRPTCWPAGRWARAGRSAAGP